MKRFCVSFVMMFLFVSHSSFGAEDPVVATFGTTKVTLSELNRLISYLDADKQRAIEEHPEYKAALLKRYMQNTVLADLARDKKFDQRQDIKDQVKMTVNDFLALEYIRKEVYEKIKISEEDLKTYYKSFPDKFKTPEMVKVRHIFFLAGASSKELREKVKAKAEAVLKRAQEGEDFGKLAAEFSEDLATNSKGGELGWFPKGKMVEDFDKAVFALKPGTVSLLETPYGFHIVEVEEKKEPTVEPYEKVKDQIRERVLEDFKKAKIDDFVDDAMKKADAKLYLEQLMPKQGDTPPAK